jgi:hypothetical protein
MRKPITSAIWMLVGTVTLGACGQKPPPAQSQISRQPETAVGQKLDSGHQSNPPVAAGLPQQETQANGDAGLGINGDAPIRPAGWSPPNLYATGILNLSVPHGSNRVWISLFHVGDDLKVTTHLIDVSSEKPYNTNGGRIHHVEMQGWTISDAYDKNKALYGGAMYDFNCDNQTYIVTVYETTEADNRDGIIEYNNKMEWKPARKENFVRAMYDLGCDGILPETIPDSKELRVVNDLYASIKNELGVGRGDYCSHEHDLPQKSEYCKAKTAG